MKTRKLTLWQAACIITGYGLGAGVLSMPYLASHNGVVVSLIVLTAALAASGALHLMIAELTLRNGGGQVISCLSRFLWRGRFGKALTITFFVLMAGILVTNLAAYIVGAGEMLETLLPLPPLAAKLAFYAVAALVVLFGLKAVGVSESIAVTAVFGLVAVLAGASLLNVQKGLPLAPGTPLQALAYFSMAMFALAAFFSVPQVVEGLDNDPGKIRAAVCLGMLNNYVLIVVITLCSLVASGEVTPDVMIGWSAAIGPWAKLVAGVFTVLAMLTTYWSLSLAMGGMVVETLHVSSRVGWLAATLPSLVLALVNMTGFMDLMRTAGGLIAIVISCMVIPAYRNACRETECEPLLRSNGLPVQTVVLAAYLLMAAGSLVPV